MTYTESLWMTNVGTVIKNDNASSIFDKIMTSVTFLVILVLGV